MTEQEIEQALLEKLGDLKYTYRPDIRDRAALEANFQKHFEGASTGSDSPMPFLPSAQAELIGKRPCDKTEP